MDLKKNKKKIILLAILVAICVLLMLVSSMQKKQHTTAPQQPATTLEEEQPTESEGLDVQAFWDEVDRQQSPLPRRDYDGTGTEPATIGSTRPTASDEFLESLSPYPSPSYVSPNEDSLIYRKGIYKRVGFVEEKKPVNDTVIIDGKAYVPVGNR